MKTSDLIRALAADNDVRAMAPGRALALALASGNVGTSVLTRGNRRFGARLGG